MLIIHDSFQSFWNIFSEGKIHGDSKCWFKYVDCTDPRITGRLSLREDGLIFSSTEPRVIFNIKNVPHNLDNLLFDTTQLQEIRKCVGRFRHKSRSSVREITNVQFHCLRSQNRIQPSWKTSTSKERKVGNPLLFKPTYDQIAKIRTEAIQKKDTCSILKQSQSSGD